MTRYRFYIGTTTKDGHDVPRGSWDVVDVILIGHFGGYTRINAYGAWRQDERTVVTEPSRVYECIGEDPDAKGLAITLRDIANQSSVLYTVEQVDGGFV